LLRNFAIQRQPTKKRTTHVPVFMPKRVLLKFARERPGAVVRYEMGNPHFVWMPMVFSVVLLVPVWMNMDKHETTIAVITSGTTPKSRFIWIFLISEQRKFAGGAFGGGHAAGGEIQAVAGEVEDHAVDVAGQ